MLEKNTIDFLKKLKNNNHRDWFEANRPKYEAARQDFLQLVELLLAHLSKTDKRFEELQAKQCIFRQNRDVRFSKDKSPYKTNFGASFSIGGKKSAMAGYYFHLDPVAGSFAGGGMWMPEAETLKKIRQEIDYDAKSFEKILNDKNFKQTYDCLSVEEKLKNPPKGYEANHPLIEQLKLKSFVATRKINNEDLLQKKLLPIIETCFSHLKPLIQFLNRTSE
jgi:uncharacterized protein (TIGR02453 family)